MPEGGISDLKKYMYDVPGRADALDADLIGNWNSVISEQVEASGGDADARSFRRDPSKLMSPWRRALEWPADPLQPAVCARRSAVRMNVQTLCDSGPEARDALHREYCEYAVLRDSEGRPKRVEVTTELREYWLCVAKHAPECVREMAAETLGDDPGWEELYGFDNPQQRSPEERERGFITMLAGGKVGNSPGRAPVGRLNTERALFMRSSINGIDDVIGTTMLGARLYAARVGDSMRVATWEEILASLKRQDLACNHADPTILLGVHTRAFDGEEVALEDPIGIYIQPPNLEVFSYRGEPFPKEWVQLSRGRSGMYQRLVFGPPDDDNAFLDDISVAVGGEDQRVVGGYQLLRELTVELRLLVARRPVGERAEVEIVKAGVRPTWCGSDKFCESVEKLAGAALSRQST